MASNQRLSFSEVVIILIKTYLMLIQMNKLSLAKDLLQIVFVRFNDWLKAINTKGGLSLSNLTHFV